MEAEIALAVAVEVEGEHPVAQAPEVVAADAEVGEVDGGEAAVAVRAHDAHVAGVGPVEEEVAATVAVEVEGDGLVVLVAQVVAREAGAGKDGLGEAPVPVRAHDGRHARPGPEEEQVHAAVAVEVEGQRLVAAAVEPEALRHRARGRGAGERARRVRLPLEGDRRQRAAGDDVARGADAAVDPELLYVRKQRAPGARAEGVREGVGAHEGAARAHLDRLETFGRGDPEVGREEEPPVRPVLQVEEHGVGGREAAVAGVGDAGRVELAAVLHVLDRHPVAVRVLDPVEAPLEDAGGVGRVVLARGRGAAEEEPAAVLQPGLPAVGGALEEVLGERALDPCAVHGAAPVRPGDQLVRAPAERGRKIPALVVDPPLGRTLDRADIQAEADPEPAVAGVAVVGERELRREPQAAGRDLDRDAGDGGPGLLQGIDLGCRGGAQDVAEEAGRIGDLLGHAGRHRRAEEHPAECGADQSQARRASERRHRLTSLNWVSEHRPCGACPQRAGMRTISTIRPSAS